MRRPRSVIVTKLVIITSSLGIIMSDSSRVKARRLPLNSSRAKAKAARVMTDNISSVVIKVNTSVLVK